jgi:DNA-binding beta-propeller fold protein YncE
MKKFYQLLLLSFLFCAVGCKKNEPIPIVNNTDLSVAQTVDAKPKPLTVITIAGLFNTQGNQDGTGEQARFNYPHGIDLADDGTLYVADLFNNAIRKVSPTGVVTTLKLPAATDGQTLQLPEKV